MEMRITMSITIITNPCLALVVPGSVPAGVFNAYEMDHTTQITVKATNSICCNSSHQQASPPLTNGD